MPPGEACATVPWHARPRPEEKAVKTILLATDGSEAAREAFHFAVELCQETGARLEVVAVAVDPPRTRTGALGLLEIERPKAVRRIAEEAKARAVDAGVEAGHRVASGDPVEAIVDLARELPADMIVVGSRGLGAVRGTLMGSVSRAVVLRSTVPVTVVRSHDRELARV
jgi:nucleotide-binding universal stress UspA family protein